MSFVVENSERQIGRLLAGWAIACLLSPSCFAGLTAQEFADVEEALVVEQAAEDQADEEVAEAQVAVNAFGVENSKMIAAKRFQLSQTFLVEVEELVRVCELDKKQALKLRIGAKGAIKKLTAEWKKRINEQMGQFPQVRPGNGDQEDGQEVKFKDADEIDENTLQLVMMNAVGNPFQYEDPRKHRFWLNIVGNVLTDAQSEKFKQYRRQRNVAKRTAMIDSAMTSLSIELGLTEQQRMELEKIIRPPMEQAEISCFTFYEPFVLYYFASKADQSEIEKCLSPAQLQAWKIFLAPSKQVGQMIEGNDGVVAEEKNLMLFIDRALDAVIEGLQAIFGAFAT